MSSNIFKWVLTIGVLFSCVTSFGLDLNQGDKQLHMATSFAMVLGGYSALRVTGASKKTSLWVATLGTIAAGFLKEYAVDKRVDPRDLEANAVGTTWGFAIPFFVEF